MVQSLFPFSIKHFCRVKYRRCYPGCVNRSHKCSRFSTVYFGLYFFSFSSKRTFFHFKKSFRISSSEHATLQVITKLLNNCTSIKSPTNPSNHIFRTGVAYRSNNILSLFFLLFSKHPKICFLNRLFVLSQVFSLFYSALTDW